MKIIYFFTSPSLHNSSVQHKVISQIIALNQIEGIECKGAFFIEETHNKLPEYKNIEFVFYKHKKRKYFDKIFRKKSLYLCVFNYFKTISFDFIYYRYTSYSKYLSKIAKLTPNLIVEINDPSLTSIPANKIPLKFNFSVLFHLIQEFYYPYILEKYFAKYFFNKLNYVVSVSGELLSMYNNWYGLKSKSVIIGNGINYEEFIPRNYNNGSSKAINLLLLKGASSKANYLGLDRIIKGLVNYENREFFKIYCAGNYFEDEIAMVAKYNLQSNFEFCGFLTSQQINTLIPKIDLAIGTLAPYRSGINEISSLKAREYIARGIPFIFGYKDTDLDQLNSIKDFTLNVPNDSSPIDFEEVELFVNSKIKSNPHHPLLMNQIAKDVLDWKIKMKKIVDFIHEKKI